MAAANAEIRAALDAFEAKPAPPVREAALWELENALEELHLKDYVHVPATFPLVSYMDRAGLEPFERARLQHRSIARLIHEIFDNLLPQPAEDAPAPRHRVREIEVAPSTTSFEVAKPAQPDTCWLLAFRPGTDEAAMDAVVRLLMGVLRGRPPVPSMPGLTRSEQAIYDALAAARGRVVPHEILRARIGRDPLLAECSLEQLRVHVHRLRAKVGADRVVLVRGTGYRLAASESGFSLMSPTRESGNPMSQLPRCSAHSRTGKPCKRLAMQDQRVCDMHGGKSPRALQAVDRRRVEAEVRSTLGIPLEVNPLQALLGQVYEAAGNVEFLRQKVQKLECLWYSYERGAKTAVGTDENGEPMTETITVLEVKPHILVQLYNQERDRLAHYAELCIKAGVAERQVKVAEAEATMMAACITGALSDPRAGLTAPQREKVRAIVIERFRQLGSAAS